MFIWRIIVHLLTYTELNSAERKRVQSASAEFHTLGTHTHGPGEALGPVHLLSHPKTWQAIQPAPERCRTEAECDGGEAAVRDAHNREYSHDEAADGGSKAITPNEAFRGP